MIDFRDLRPDEIECRVQQVKQNGLSILLYKTARTDADILDETVGPHMWQCRFYECKGTLFCSVGINIDGEWVWKDDAGEPSNMSAQKGEASDAFKRACFKWDLGRELYSAPFVWVPREKCNIKQNGQRYQCFDRFSCAKIQIEDGEITGLRINNDTQRCVAYSWKKGK